MSITVIINAINDDTVVKNYILDSSESLHGDFDGESYCHVHEFIADAIKNGFSVRVKCLDDEPCYIYTAQDYADTYNDEVPFLIEQEISRVHKVSAVATVNNLPRWIEEALDEEALAAEEGE